VDTRDTPVSVSRDLAYFSPNGDGSQDTLAITPVVPLTEGIKSWSVTVLDSRRASVRVFQGSEEAPAVVTFDGLDDGGRVIDEGNYTAELSVLYTNGNNPEAMTEGFEVDLTPPSVALRTNPRIISPNEDGRQDRLAIYQETSVEETWSGAVADSEGNVVRSISWRGTPDPAIEWDGLDNSGTLVANGTYVYTLSSMDKAGNYAESASEPVVVDLRETPVALSVEGAAFSPNSDSVKDSIRLIPDIADTSGIRRLTVTMYDSSQAAVRTLTTSEVPEFFTWDGRNNSGRVVTDGSYSAEFVAEYNNGNAPAAKAGPVIVDTRFPNLRVSAENLFFSPDGDGNGDTLTITQVGNLYLGWGR
jgi:flagellar hook assembly protein FlgD